MHLLLKEVRRQFNEVHLVPLLFNQALPPEAPLLLPREVRVRAQAEHRELNEVADKKYYSFKIRREHTVVRLSPYFISLRIYSSNGKQKSKDLNQLCIPSPDYFHSYDDKPSHRIQNLISRTTDHHSQDLQKVHMESKDSLNFQV